MGKYEYLTGEDIGFKPSTVEQTKFEYSPLDKIFNEGLNEDDQKEGHFKRLENIKDTNSTQSQAIKDWGEQQLRELKKSNTLKVINEIRRKNHEADKILLDVTKTDTKLDTEGHVCTKTDGTKYEFNILAPTLKFVEKIHNYEIVLDEAIEDQNKLEKLIFRLNNCNAKSKKEKKKKREF